MERTFDVAALCEGQLPVEIWTMEQSIEDTVMMWAEYHTATIPLPKYRFCKPVAQILFESTTVVWVELDMASMLQTPVSYLFDDRKYEVGLPHLLFVGRVDGLYIVLGSLLCRNFVKILEQRGQLRFSDLLKPEYPLFFAGLEVFDAPTYYHTSPDPDDRLYYPDDMDVAVRQKFIEIQTMTTAAIPVELQPVAFSLTMFAASASDRWSDRLIENETKWFGHLLLRFNDFPYWQFELARKWTRADWRPIALPYWRLSDQLKNRGRLYVATMEHAEFHFPPALRATSHVIMMEAKRVPWSNPLVQCNCCIDRFDCPRPTLRHGRVAVSLQMFPIVAVESLRLRLRERVQTIRLQHFTTLGGFWYAKIRANDLDKIATFVDVQSKLASKTYSDLVLTHIYEVFQRSFSARDNFSLETARDYVVLHRTIIPLIWGDRMVRMAPLSRRMKKLKPQKRVVKRLASQNDLSVALHRPDAAMMVQTEGRFDLSTYEQFIAHTDVFWPPCMQLLAHTYVGNVHMTHTTRRRVALWLTTLGDVYSDEQLWMLWRWMMWGTAKYQHMALSGNFESTEMGSALKHTLEKQREREQPYSLGCKSQTEKARPEDPAARVYCPFASGEMPDIEEAAAPQRQCAAELSRRMQMHGRPALPGSYVAFTPAWFTREAIKKLSM